MIDRIACQAVTLGPASVGYSIHNGRVFSLTVPYFKKDAHTHTLRGSGCPYPLGCEMRARNRRMRDPCTNAAKKLGFERPHVFWRGRALNPTHETRVLL